jgi:hypothetical protein
LVTGNFAALMRRSTMRRSRLALPVALAILVATSVVFAAFLWRVAAGGAYEMRTVGAMTLRTAFWAAMAWVAWRAR